MTPFAIREMAEVRADAQVTCDDEDFLDREQGIPHLKGIPCQVRPCPDPRTDPVGASEPTAAVSV